MIEDRDLPVEMSSGQRPPGAGGDRLVVGLAALVLIGAVLIVAGKVLPRDKATADASPSPSPVAARASAKPSGKPTPTPQPPTPSPTPAQVVLLPGTLPSESQQPAGFNGWIRAKVDLQVYSGNSEDSLSVGSLAPGDVAYAWFDGPANWLQVQDPQPGGWILETLNGASTLERIIPLPTTWSGSISWLAATASGFVATAVDPSRSDASWPGEHVITSRDGSSWTAAPGGARPNAPYAQGPAGWLAYTVHQDDPCPEPCGQHATLWLWSSPDGVSWKVLGAWAGSSTQDPYVQDQYPQQLVGSSRGYVLTFNGGSRFGGAGVDLWFSPDGLTWEQTAGPAFAAYAQVQLAATSSGFYAYLQYADEGYAVITGAFSADGRRWRAVSGGPQGASLQLGAVGDRLLGLDRDPTTSAVRAWIGSAVRDGFVWRRDTAADEAFRGAVVTAAASDGKRIAVFGWDRQTEAALAWIGDGQRWRRSALLAAFGGIPRLAAAGPAGVVVVGYRANLRGDNPIIWHETASGGWAPESTPIIALAPDPRRSECPASPGDALAFAILDRPAAITCFGSAPITFRAWNASCDGCYGEPSGVYEPAWLAAPTSQQLYLSPIANGSNNTQAILSPAVGLDPSWTGRWLEVTGHFDDPAAGTCRYVPAPQDLGWYGGNRSTIDGCRQQFVVTRVHVVDGPR